MYATAVTLVLFLCTVDLFVAGNFSINAYKSETGEFLYSSALSCSYLALYFSHPYNKIRAGYRATDDIKCCYRQETRHKCCLQMDSKDSSPTCRCDPSVNCGMKTTTTTTTTVPTTATTTTTTAPTTATETTTTVPTTATLTRTTVLTTATTTVPTITTTVPTTATTTVPTTATTTVPTITTTVPTTTRTTVPTTATTTVPTITTTVSTTTRTTVPTTTRTTVPTTTRTTVPTITTTVPTTATTTVRTATTTITAIPITTASTTVVATTTNRSTTIRIPAATTTNKTTTTKGTTATATTTSRSTTTTVTTTTTTPIKPLCQSTSPALNGDRASNNCLNSGVFKIAYPDGTISGCNAVYTKANVNGVYKPTILTFNNCIYFIQLHTNPEHACLLLIGNQKYKIREPTFTLVLTDDETAFIDVAQSEISILDEVAACQDNFSCLYNKNTMQGHVDLTTCKMFSWAEPGTEGYSQNALNEVALTISLDGCPDIDAEFVNGLCFKTRDGKSLTCRNRSFYIYPVYCKAIETQEQILIGVTSTCDRSSHIWVHSSDTPVA